MKAMRAALVMLLLAGCAGGPAWHNPFDHTANDLEHASKQRVKPPAAPEAVTDAMLPPLLIAMPKSAAPVEPRFDLSVNNAPADQVFMAIVSGTRYSMNVRPDVKGLVTVALKNVTVHEALDTIRDLYGYEYRIDGTRITVEPVSFETRIFQINYLQAQRQGRTETRVSSGSISNSPSAGGTTGLPGQAALPGGGGQSSVRNESTSVSTTSHSDFWGDLTKSLDAIVGRADGRQVIVNPQSGVIVVRALPKELRNVARFLTAMQIVVEREVVLEAKIIQVTLNQGYQAGINWAAFRNGNTRFAGGFVSPGTTVTNNGSMTMPVTGSTASSAAALSATLGATGSLSASPASPGGIFGLALQTTNFASLLAFLQTQGTINVLSSPRIATINNQKAVLKVGTDEFFVTNVSTTAVTTGAGTTTTPTISVQPFFSGIALDVTPQIDDENNIILHVHPSVSAVSEVRKDINLGNIGTFTLPLASSNINETDTIVRVQNGNIVAIGGLMQEQTTQNRSEVPGAGGLPGVGGLFRQRADTTTKSELVILLKPTIIRSERSWKQDLQDTSERIRGMWPGVAP